jgi:hypothetical protein
MPKPEPDDRPYDDLPGPIPLLDHPWKYFANYVRYKTLTVGLILSLVLIALFCMREAFRLPDNPFLSEFLVVLTAGIGTFLIAPIVVACAARWRGVTVGGVLLISALCAFAAFWREGTLGSLLVEASVSLVLLVALEMLFHHLVKSTQLAYEKRKEALDRGAGDEEGGDDETDPPDPRFGFPLGDSDE